MTLHEQCKEDIKKTKDEYKCIDSFCDNHGNIPYQVGEDEWEAEQCQFCYELGIFKQIKTFKQSYLNSIDCMIADNKSELILEPSSSRGQGHNDALKIMIKYYFEQRELIANEK